MYAANIWHHVYILFSALPLNCYHWRDSELSLRTQPGVWRALLLRGAGGDGSGLAKDKCFVQVLELDPFSPRRLALPRCLRCLQQDPGACERGLEYGAAAFNLTMWFSWNFSVLWLEYVKMDSFERLKFPMCAVTLIPGRIRTVPWHIEQPTCGG